MTGTGLKTSSLVFQLCLGTPHSFFHNENFIDRKAWQAAVHGIAEPDMTEWLSFTYYKNSLAVNIEHFLKFSVLCYGIIGAYSCRRRRRFTAVFVPGESRGQRNLVGCCHRVAQSWTRLKLLCMNACMHALEKQMATHSSILPWRILGMAEPGGLSSMGSYRVGHDWSDLAAAAASLQEPCLELREESNTIVFVESLCSLGHKNFSCVWHWVL